MNPEQFFFENFALQDGERRPLIMKFLTPDLGFEVPTIDELSRKLARVEGEAYMAVHGWVVGLRDGSPYTMDRCRDLGQAISAVIHYLKRDDSKNLVMLHKAMNELEELEKGCREKGNQLPYE